MFESTSVTRRNIFVGAFALILANGTLKAQSELSSQAANVNRVASANGVSVLTVNNQGPAVDFVNAKVKALPINPFPSDMTQALIQASSNATRTGPSGYSIGSAGSGKTTAASVGVPAAQQDSAEAGVTPDDFGTSNHPFTTSRADLYSLNTNTAYPYRAAGKLFFNESTGSFICSASLIKRGIVVTAAHCVAKYGANLFYSGWQFVPGYRAGAAPFGVWTAKQVWVKTAYLNGTDNCAVYGVVCPDDVAIIILNPQNNAYPGATAGWLGYLYGTGFSGSSLIQVTQLGYPAGLDGAGYMERNDSYGYVSASNSGNTVIGSNMNGGSSGGPWIVNFGLPYALTGETNGGSYNTNAVVGVTSWGSTSTGPKEQGAAPFTANNVQSLLTSACTATPGACS